MSTEEIIDDILAERNRQNEKWGEQNHPNGTGWVASPPRVIFSGDASSYSLLANRAKRLVDMHSRHGFVTYLEILLEEFLEAAAADNESELEEELTQVAAVCVQWREAIQRKRDSA